MRIIASPAVITLFTAISSSLPTYAADVTLYINGDIVASSCTVENNGMYNIDLGHNIPSRRLNAANSYSTWTEFYVTLSHCPVGTSRVTAPFTGPLDGTNPNLYANVSSPDSSRNVAIELQRITGSVNAGSGKSIAVDVDNNRQAIFDMRARIFSVTGGATAGHISAMVVMNFTYN